MSLKQREAVEHVAAEQLAKQPQAVSQPKEPSERQRQIHELTHLPYARWCPACVTARGIDDKHVRVVPDGDATDAEVTTVFYANRSDREVAVLDPEDKKWPVLVAADKFSHAILVVPAEQKGGHSSQRLVRELYNFAVKVGMTGVILQSDNENSVTNVIKAVEKMRLSQGMPTTVRVSEKGQPSSNGRAERAVRTAKEMGRVLRHYITERSGYVPEPGHPLYVWSIVHGAYL